ncbi:MAG: acylglycerol kinase family protein, partial [Planctomycetaceae bacterium]|nr:acylglycerol kinase family protein [Planctomycetaceae bacterium]
MPRKLIAIANPISGKGKAARLGPRLARLARESGVEIHLRLTTHAGHSQELAHDARAEGYDAIVACGGDGTVNDIVNGMRDSFYVDAADGYTPVESVIVKELVPHIDKTLRTFPEREARMIEGFSILLRCLYPATPH